MRYSFETLVDVVLPILEFDSTFEWLFCEGPSLKHAMRLGCQVTKPSRILHLDGTQKFTKAIFHFQFVEVNYVQAIFQHIPWYVRSSLLVIQLWSQEFFVSNNKILQHVPICLDFLGLLFPCWHFLPTITCSLGKAICVEVNFYHAQPHKWVCTFKWIYLLTLRKTDIQIRGIHHTYRVLYLNLQNTFF